MMDSVTEAAAGGGSDGNQEEDLAVNTQGPGWHVLAGALTLEEQIRLFGFVHERDATEWDKLAPCMNPTPKTLELVQQQGAPPARTLSYGPNDETAVVKMVAKAIGVLHAKSRAQTIILHAKSARHTRDVHLSQSKPLRTVVRRGFV